MKVTPALAARQIAAARAARVVPFGGDRLAFTSETGVVRPVRIETVETWEDYCFICSRCTDHAGEHYDVAEYVQTYTSERVHDGVRYIHTSTYVSRAEGPGMPWEEVEKLINAAR